MKAPFFYNIFALWLKDFCVKLFPWLHTICANDDTYVVIACTLLYYITGAAFYTIFNCQCTNVKTNEIVFSMFHVKHF